MESAPGRRETPFGAGKSGSLLHRLSESDLVDCGSFGPTNGVTRPEACHFRQNETKNAQESLNI